MIKLDYFLDVFLGELGQPYYIRLNMFRKGERGKR